MNDTDFSSRVRGGEDDDNGRKHPGNLPGATVLGQFPFVHFTYGAGLTLDGEGN